MDGAKHLMSDDPRSTPPPAPQSDAPTGQLRQSAALTIEVVGETDKGRVRPGNEDNLIHEDPHTPLARAHGTLMVVSDGMGGHAAGEIASEIAVKTIHGTFYRQRGVPVGEAVRDAIVTANTAIYEAAQRNRERAGMGCTVVVLVVQGADLTIGHVGDSRAYLIRGGVATQLTLDHSWVAMQVHEGILTPEQAEHHPNRSVLMRALGRQAAVEVDISTRKLRAGDVLLVCSDGLTGMVTDAEIAEYASRVPAKALPRQLIDLANQRGAPDNVTVLVGAISGGPVATQILATPSGAGQDPNASTTIIATPKDARTLRPDASPAGDTPTDRNLPRPKPAATVSSGPASTAGGSQRTPTPPPATSTPEAPGTPGARTGQSAAGSAPTARVPHGKPVVVARSSVTEPADAGAGRGRGRGQWIAGAVAAFGLAAALLLLVAFQGGVFGTSSTSTSGAASSGATGAPPAATVVPAAVATAVTPNPSILLPAPAAATPIGPAGGQQPAATPTSASSKPAIAPTVASSPAATNPTPTLGLPVVPAIPTIRGILATVVPTRVPTATPIARTGEAPTTSSEAPAASGQGPGGAADTTADPSMDEGQPSETPPEGGSSEGAPPEEAPGPASDAPQQAQPQPQPKPGGGVLPRGIPQLGSPSRKPNSDDD